MNKINKVIVISHDTRCDGVGSYNGMIFPTKDAAVKYLKSEGFTGSTEDRYGFGWLNDSDYCDEENHIVLTEREIK